MKNKLKVFESTGILILIIHISFLSYAQLPVEPEVLSPNATVMQSFGGVPVNYFIGSPNVSIPIYTIRYGSISVPISLNYNKELVKPSEIAGWTGMGWNLSCGGLISRKVNGRPDEYLDSDDLTYNGYYGFIESGSNQIVYSGGLKSLSELYNDFTSTAYQCDIQADEFSFNFLNYSGKFFYTNEGWQVVSDNGDIKVVEWHTQSKDDPTVIRDRFPGNQAKLANRAIKSFVLVTEDGTRYTFGNYNENVLNAIEFSNDYKSNYNFPYSPENLTANTWYLTAITDIKQNQIIFQYDVGDPTCRVSYQLEQLTSATINFDGYDCGPGNDDPDECQPAVNSIVEALDYYRKSGRTLFPVYLKHIQCSRVGGQIVPGPTIDFTSIISSYAPYSYVYLGNDPQNSPCLSSSWMKFSATELNLKWRQLTDINITEPSQRETKYEFKYNTDEGGASYESLFLNSIQRVNSNLSVTDVPEEKYAFEYNPFDFDMLGNSLNKFGYNNSSDNGLLTKITYPTKGSTEFAWENNDYYFHVDATRNDLSTDIGTLSTGCRIKRIIDKDLDGAELNHREFFYTLDSPTQTSSGIMNAYPFDDKSSTFDFRPPTVHNNTIDAETDYSISLYNRNGLSNYTNNGQSLIGYSRVVEEDTKLELEKTYLYSNYGINNLYDIPPVDWSGWSYGDDQYMRMSPISNKLGKLIKYTEKGSSYEKSITYQYGDIYTGEPPIHRIEVDNEYIISYVNECMAASEALIFATTLIEPRSKYKLISQVDSLKFYGESQTTTTLYDYNNFGLLKEQEIIINSNESFTEKYHYYEGNVSFSPAPPYYWSTFETMYSTYHILNRPFLLQTIYKNGIESEVIKASFIEYQDEWPFWPTSVYSLNQMSHDDVFGATFQENFANDGVFKEEASYEYDWLGNIIKVIPSNGPFTFYFWGTDRTVPIAKLVTAEDVTITDLFRTQIKNYSEEDKRSAIEGIVGSTAHVLFTYKSSIGEGIISETGPNGMTTYYDYDEAGRLMDIKNNEEHLLTKFKYKMANTPEQ